MTEILFAFLWAITIIWGIIEIAPNVQEKYYRIHGLTLIVITALNYFINLEMLTNVLIYNVVLIVWLMLAYRMSSFTTSTTVVLLYIGQMLTSIITSNVSLFLLRRIYDFRVLFHQHDYFAMIIYVFVFFLILRYYHLVKRLFKNIANIDKYYQRLIVLCDLVIFSLFIMYQKYTFINLTAIVRSGSLEVNASANKFMLFSYIALTVMAMLVILMVNRQLIINNNLEKYKFKAEVDPMTGVLSRDAGINYLKDAMNKSVRYDYDLTIAYLDVNDLKIVNDKFGHREGDKLLRYITEIVQSNLRDLDVIARLGGDEFMIIFSKCNLQQASRIWKRIQDEFTHINKSGTLAYGMSASVGFTQFDKMKHTSASSILNEADSAMYEQKKTSKAKSNHRYPRT